MRTSRGWPVAAPVAVALLCAVVAVCADPPDPPSTGPEVEDEGGELAMMAAGSEGADTIFDPFGPRLALGISASGDLLPDAPVTLTVSGEAREAIDSGEVIVTLPTKAAMDYAGPGRQPYYPLGDTLPTEASWRLPTMAKGDTWEGTVTVPAAVAGYYMVAVAADTDGPESALGPYLFDESYAQAWMFVSATDGQLTTVFEDSLFPEGVRPVPGPFTTEAELAAREPTNAHYNENVSVKVIYYYGGSFQPAVGAKVWARYTTMDGKHTDGLETYRIVPEDGIVRFPCPTKNYPRIRGEVDLPNTIYVEGVDGFYSWYSAYRNSCGSRSLLSLQGDRRDYLPWRNLNDVIPRINDHFGYSRPRLKWEVDLDTVGAWFRWFCCTKDEYVLFGRNTYYKARVAAHEYTHALHYKSMGSYWKSDNCNPHGYYRPSSYTCAFSEGLAQYGSWVGAPDDYRYHMETIPETVADEPTKPKPKVEAHVAALFHDLIDGGTSGPDHPGEIAEPADKTQYSAHYVMKVFATCEVQFRRNYLPDNWEDRNKVSDFVWCLENRVDTLTHGSIFWDSWAPKDVKEKAIEPADWDPDSIRSTWLWNMR